MSERYSNLLRNTYFRVKYNIFTVFACHVVDAYLAVPAAGNRLDGAGDVLGLFGVLIRVATDDVFADYLRPGLIRWRLGMLSP